MKTEEPPLPRFCPNPKYPPRDKMKMTVHLCPSLASTNHGFVDGERVSRVVVDCARVCGDLNGSVVGGGQR
jgi:hypothetical protein